jgi:hypothetical protein
MKIEMMFNEMSLGLLYIITVVIVLLSVICGLRFASYIQRREKSKKEAPVGSIVAAILGLLAFILAFTFGMASSRYDTRKQLLLDEVNAIGTAFLRTDFLPETQRRESRKLFKEYVDSRVRAVLQPETLPQALVDSETIHDRLWSQITALAKQSSDSVVLGLYIQSLNEVIDLHAKRVTIGLKYHIPGVIWLTLYFVTILAMAAVGYQFGLAGTSSWLSILLLALSFSAVILLIADLDRVSAGLVKVSQKPMIEFQQKLSTLAY